MITEEKRKLRKLFINKRQSLSREEKTEKDRKISEIIIKSDFFDACDSLLAYYPVRNETDILPVIEVALKLNKKVAFPLTYKNGIMDFRYVFSLEDLVTGRYGIPEPSQNSELFLGSKSALCIVPALSYDFYGYRLGYGGGYYERFLSCFNGHAVGAMYSDFISKKLPHDENDIKISTLITEGGVINCRNE